MAELYTDVTVTERSQISQAGKIVKYYRVSATTKGGVYFTINVPEKQFNKDKIDSLLSEKAASIDDIQEL